MRGPVSIATVLMLVATACTNGGDIDATEASAVGSVAVGAPAPALPADSDWVNPATAPLPATGPVTIIHFWRSSCVSCVETLGDLDALQAELGDRLVVVGVHSPKFPRETDADIVRREAQRVGFSGLVVNDPDLEIWTDWGIAAWPTTAVVDSAGNLAGGHIGVGAVDALRLLLTELTASAEPATAVVPAGLGELAPTVLSFPEAVLADPAGNRLIVADTGHHRIVVADLDTYEVQAVIGTGTPGNADGPAAVASFASPRGMALDPDGATLYVADTDNHLIRRVDLETLEVMTAAGTGAWGEPLSAAGPAADTALAAPWDLAFAGAGLHVTLAGVNQIALLDLESNELSVVAGSGRQGTASGAPDEAELAAPAGIAADSTGATYVVDAESGAVRKLGPDGAVEFVAGGATGLFEFGDVDGRGDAVRLQQPHGIAFGSNSVWIADTFNSKIKRLDPTTGRVETLVGGEGWRDGPAPLFAAPTGIEYTAGALYVADRDNHSIRTVDPATGDTSTVIFEGIERLVPDDAEFDGTYLALDAVDVAAGPGTVTLNVSYPAGYKANELAPSRFEWVAEGGVVQVPADADRSIPGPTFPLEFEFAFDAGEGRLQADMWLVYCETIAESICLFDRVRFDIPLRVGTTGASDIELEYEVTLPDGL